MEIFGLLAIFVFFCSIFCSGVIRDLFYQNHNVYPTSLYKVEDLVEFYNQDSSTMKTGVIVRVESSLTTYLSFFYSRNCKKKERIRYLIDTKAKSHIDAVANMMNHNDTHCIWIDEEDISRNINLIGRE